MRTETRGLLCIATLLAAFSLCAAQQANLSTAGAPQSDSKTAIASYAKLPMTFEGNVGQTDSQVKFLARSSGHVVFLTSGGMVFSARSQFVAKDGAPANAQPASKQTQNGAVIQLNMVGANPNPTAVGEDPQPGKANYFIGRDPKKWHTNVVAYGKVHYKGVYPGIDLVYYGNHSQLEYDFEVAAGADPRQIQFDVKGADSVSVDSTGDLVLQTKQGALHIKSPVLYQTFNNMKLPINGGFSLKNATRVGFSLQGYDKTKPLVIDPVLLYSTFLGGLADDQAVGVAVDSLGSAYVAGWTESTNFPLASQASQASGQNGFIVKLDVSGSTLVYADFIGGSGYNYDNPTAVTLDSNNDAYITGYTQSADFPLVNAFQTTMNDDPDGFISKVSPDGSLLYSTYLGGSNYGGTYSSAIAVDGSQNMYVAGYTYDTGFPTYNAVQSSVSPNQEGYYGYYGFVTALTADGSSLIYSTYLAGSTNVITQCYGGPCWPSPLSQVSGIALDSSADAYVTGYTNTYNFPTTPGAYMPSQNSPNDAQLGFVSELSSSGSAVYSTYFGLTDGYPTTINAIAVDSNGSAYVTGWSYSDGTFPITTPSLCDPGTYGWGCSYGFITKFNPTGTGLAYSTFLPPNNDSFPQALALDAQDDAYVVGYAYGGGVSTVNPIEAYTNQEVVLLTEIDPTGSIQLFSTYLGGNGNDFPTGIALDASGSMYVVGYTDSSDFPVTAAALQNTIGGNNDCFVAKIGTANAPAVAISPSLVQFSIRPVGSVSQPNTSLLRNMGSAALTISSITISGDFSETDTCGSGVPAAGTCTFTVTFTPTAPGPRFGSILVQDDGAGSPHFINLVGDGSTAIATLSSTSLTFPSLQIGQTSPQQTVTLTNNGNATLNLTSSVITGDYAQTNNCPSALGVGSVCTYTITFTPTAGGARNGTLTLTDNAPNSPQTISLTGSGYVTTAKISPSSLTFSNQSVGSTSAAQTVTITNTGDNPMTVSGATTSGDFAQTNQCSSIATNQSCTISVTFTPTVAGSRSGTLIISDNAQGNPHSVTLGGTGIASAAGFSATSLTFPLQSVGSTSAAQSITLTDSGNGQLTVTGIQVTGDFAQTNNCSTVAANGGTCTVQVTFTPTATGSRTGTIVFTDSAPNSPQTISLSGTAGAPANSLSATSLTFAAQVVGSSSAPQPVTLTNSGTTTMAISGVSAAGDFSQTNNCPANLAPAGNCTINVTFTPVAGGTRAGSLIVSDNALGGSASVTLSGTGIASGVSFSPTSLTFPSQSVGSTSTAQPITLTNSGSGQLTVTNIQATGDFAQTNNCPANLAPAGNCTINVTFTPVAGGTRTGSLIVSDNALGGSAVFALSGSGSDFSLTASGNGTATVKPGATATYPLTFASSGGPFPSQVSLTCIGSPVQSTCTISPATIPAGSSSASVTVSVSTTAVATASLSQPHMGHDRPVLAAWIFAPGFLVFGLVSVGGKRRKIGRRYALLALLIGLALFAAACGAGSNTPAPTGTGTTPGTYTLVVKASSGSLNNTVPLTLTVQ